jgi:choline kinase
VSIDVAIPDDKNVIKKEAEKNLQYKDFITENQCKWNMKAKVIPVIRGATGTIPKSLRQYLSNMTGKHEIKELQTTAILDTAHKLREVQVYKYKTLHERYNITCSTNCKYRTVATLYALEKWFVSGI